MVHCSNARTRFQSFFMLMTVHPCFLASASSALARSYRPSIAIATAPIIRTMTQNTPMWRMAFMGLERRRELYPWGAAQVGAPVSLSWLTKVIRCWIPEITLQTQASENRAHFIRLRTPRTLVQSSRVPSRRERPELVNPYERSHRVSMRRAPLANSFFRPEEEHVASGENDILPPLGRWDQAVEEPRGGLRALKANL